MILSPASEKRLLGVHPDLVRVIRTAASATSLPFIVTEGLRTYQRQKQLVAAGASRTLASRHLSGHAVDLAVVLPFEDRDGDGVDDDGIHGLRWDWPLYRRLATEVKRAAAECRVPIVWGGDWRTFKDGPHYELPVKLYPAPA